MFSKNFFTIFLAVVVCFIGSYAVSAQVAASRGIVYIINADNTKTPAAGVTIETYRTDIKAKGPKGTTSKKGEFVFAGLQLGASYFIVVSGANISPQIQPNVRAGDEGIVINVVAGDGKTYTEAEAREAYKNPSGTTQPTTTAGNDNGKPADTGSANRKPAESTADQKKQQEESAAEQKRQKEEYDKKVAEVTAKNEKMKNGDAILAASFKEGNAAKDAKNYDLAISKYDTGIAAVPDFVGSTPALLNNKAIALRLRAVDNYNANLKTADATAKLQAMTGVKKDLADSADSYNQAWTIIKNAPQADLTANPNAQNYKKDTLDGARETFRIMALTEQVEPTKIDIAKVLLPEYLAIATDPAEKTKAQVILGDIYRVNNDSENAVAEYKKVLDSSPDNLEALSGIGFSLVNLGYLNSDKAKMQEGADYLQKFYAGAPDTNKYKADAKATIDLLKKEQNLTPQKIPAKKKG